MRALRIGVLLAAAVALGGCGLLGGTGAGPGVGFDGGASCSMLPRGACEEQMSLAAARHPDATRMDLTCTVPVCDRASGAGTVVVTLASGAKVSEAFTYRGDPGPVPPPVCTGLPPDTCAALARSTVDEVLPSKAIRAISITCAAGPCTANGGEADVIVKFADGTEYTTYSGWDGPLP